MLEQKKLSRHTDACFLPEEQWGSGAAPRWSLCADLRDPSGWVSTLLLSLPGSLQWSTYKLVLFQFVTRLHFPSTRDKVAFSLAVGYKSWAELQQNRTCCENTRAKPPPLPPYSTPLLPHSTPLLPVDVHRWGWMLGMLGCCCYNRKSASKYPSLSVCRNVFSFMPDHASEHNLKPVQLCPAEADMAALLVSV